MGLSVYTYYETFKPHFSFRFKVDFLANPTFYRLVQDIKLPSISINASDGRKRFGQTQIVLPFFEFGDQELEVTFIETDDMKVLNYLTNTLRWPNKAKEEELIVTEYDDTMSNIIKRTLYKVCLFSYNAPQWQNSGSPSNMTISATYLVRASKDITKDEYDLFNLPIYSPIVDLNQDLNVIGSSVDEGSDENEWQKFIGSLKNEMTDQQKIDEFNKSRQEAMMNPMAFDTNVKAREMQKVRDEKLKNLNDEIGQTLVGSYEYLNDEAKQKLDNDGFKRYCNSELNGTYRDFSMLSDEEKKMMREKYDKLGDSEKMLLMYNIDAEDGLDANEKKIIEQSIGLMVNGGDLTKEDMADMLGNLENKEAEYVQAAKDWQYAIDHPDQGRGGEGRVSKTQMAAAIPAGAKYSEMTDAEQKAYLKQLLKSEISGEATNGHSRKEGNDNQVYSNPFDSKKYNPTQMNYGYGNTYEKLKALGADKAGPVKFEIKKDVTIDGKKYKKGDTIEYANLTAANNALKDEKFGSNAITLEQSSADRLNELVLNDMAGKMQQTFKKEGIEDVIDSMNKNAQMGLTHMIYGGEGTMKNVASNLKNNKQEALDSLNANSGYLGNDFVEKHKNDKGSTYKSTNAKTGDTMSWNRLDYMSEKGKTIVKTKGNKTT